jgi:hypothetical protein
MRTRLLSAALAAAGVLALAISPAAAAAAVPVLTLSNGTTPVGAGDVLAAGAKSGTTSTITTTSGGSTAITCNTTAFSANVTMNPPKPGTATLSITALTLTGCTSNIQGIAKINSVTLNDLPYVASITPANGGGTVTVDAGPTGPIQLTESLQTELGAVTCVYTDSSLAGTYINADSAMAFTNQQLTLKSGPPICPKNSFLNVDLAPVVDTTQASQDVIA